MTEPNLSSAPLPSPYARTAEIALELPLPQEKFFGLVAHLRESLGDELPKIVQKKDNCYSLRNNETEISKQISLIIETKRVYLVWGKEVQWEKVKSILVQMAQTCTEAIMSLSRLLRHIDTEYVYEFNTSLNHYVIIHDTFFAATGFTTFLHSQAGMKNLSNDFQYSVLLPGGNILVVTITGSHEHGDIISGRLEEEELRVRISVGKVSGFEDAPLDKLFEKHLSEIDKLVTDKIVPDIVLPVAKTISKLQAGMLK